MGIVSNENVCLDVGPAWGFPPHRPSSLNKGIFIERTKTLYRTGAFKLWHAMACHGMPWHALTCHTPCLFVCLLVESFPQTKVCLLLFFHFNDPKCRLAVLDVKPNQFWNSIRGCKQRLWRIVLMYILPFWGCHIHRRIFTQTGPNCVINCADLGNHMLN